MGGKRSILRVGRSCNEYVLILVLLMLSTVALPLWLLIMLIHLLLRWHAGGFGEQLGEGLFLRVDVQANPPKQINVSQKVDYNIDHIAKEKELRKYLRWRGHTKLLHSSIYSDDKVLNEIVGFIHGSRSNVPK